jgi:hypothetical protein
MRGFAVQGQCQAALAALPACQSCDAVSRWESKRHTAICDLFWGAPSPGAGALRPAHAWREKLGSGASLCIAKVEQPRIWATRCPWKMPSAAPRLRAGPDRLGGERHCERTRARLEFAADQTRMGCRASMRRVSTAGRLEKPSRMKTLWESTWHPAIGTANLSDAGVLELDRSKNCGR